MKPQILTTLHLTLFITSCQKKPDPSASTDTTDPLAKAQFENSDAIISTYLDKLDSAETPYEEKVQIICKDYSAEYKAYYIPALLKLSPKYTRLVY